MSGASSVRVTRKYYALVLEDTISYDFEYESDARDHYASEQEEYLTELTSILPYIDSCIESLLLRCNKCVLDYEGEQFLFPDVLTPYYSDLLEYGDSPIGQLYGIPIASQKAVVLRGLVSSGSSDAGKYLNLEIVAAGKILASDLVTIADTLELVVAEQWLDKNYHVLVRPLELTPKSNIATTAISEEGVGFGDGVLLASDGYDDGSADANEQHSDNDIFAPSPFDYSQK